jgi:hypothetical protein
MTLDRFRLTGPPPGAAYQTVEIFKSGKRSATLQLKTESTDSVNLWRKQVVEVHVSIDGGRHAAGVDSSAERRQVHLIEDRARGRVNDEHTSARVVWC